jgi:hypothetical protein
MHAWGYDGGRRRRITESETIKQIASLPVVSRS